MAAPGTQENRSNWLKRRVIIAVAILLVLVSLGIVRSIVSTPNLEFVTKMGGIKDEQHGNGDATVTIISFEKDYDTVLAAMESELKLKGWRYSRVNSTDHTRGASYTDGDNTITLQEFKKDQNKTGCWAFYVESAPWLSRMLRSFRR